MLFDVIRKINDYVGVWYKHIDKLRIPKGKKNQYPKLLANSIPKSGTHLLTQVLEPTPNTKLYGTFLATKPTFPHRKTSTTKLLRKVNRIVPGEIARAHLEFNEILHRELENQKILHFFIYRDPRDVVISEAMYLTYMNKWHGMHKYFISCNSDEDRIMLAIKGLSDSDKVNYPDVGKRLSPFLKWLELDSVIGLKFEDLVEPRSKKETINKIANSILNNYNISIKQNDLVHQMIINIDPGKSHTFRSGGTRKWEKKFTDNHIDAFNRYGKNLIDKLGYEQS